jgi:hypothetical protein
MLLGKQSLCLESYKIYNTLCEINAESLIVKASDTYSYHWALKVNSHELSIFPRVLLCVPYDSEELAAII